MLCQRCKKNKATTVFTQTINNTTTKEHICSECAREAMDKSSSMFNSFFDDFPFSGFMSKPMITSGKRCENCGMSFEEIMELGRLGCSDCYSVFAGELAPTIQNIHGKATHMGKRPHGFTKELPPAKDEKSAVEILNEKLKKAVDEQNYERAAKLRDEIKRLQEE